MLDAHSIPWPLQRSYKLLEIFEAMQILAQPWSMSLPSTVQHHLVQKITG